MGKKYLLTPTSLYYSIYISMDDYVKIMRKLILFLFTICVFTLPVRAAAPDSGKLSFQFRFMNMEETDYRLTFLKKQLSYFDFEADPDLNQTLITQLLMLVDANFEWEEEKIGNGISDLDFSADPQDIYEKLFPEEHERIYLTQLVDSHNMEAYFEYLKSVQEKYADYDHIIFLGDSRFVGIRDYTGYDERCQFICEIGMGYSYLTETGYQTLVDYYNNHGGNAENTAVVINLGVNDLTGGGPFDSLAAQYADFINQNIVPLGFDIYYMSVNPVDDASCAASGYTISNDKVANFNVNLHPRLSEEVTWLDTYSWFLENGLACSGDGLHYPANTNQALVSETIVRLDTFK